MSVKKSAHITAFYLETLLLITVFIAIILVLTQVFGLAQEESAEARALTDAVALAQNAAEAFSLAETPEALRELLGESAVLREDPLSLEYRDGAYRVELDWRADGVLAESTVRIFRDGITDPVYTLETGSFKEAER